MTLSKGRMASHISRKIKAVFETTNQTIYGERPINMEMNVIEHWRITHNMENDPKYVSPLLLGIHVCYCSIMDQSGFP